MCRSPKRRLLQLPDCTSRGRIARIRDQLTRLADDIDGELPSAPRERVAEDDVHDVVLLHDTVEMLIPVAARVRVRSNRCVFL